MTVPPPALVCRGDPGSVAGYPQPGLLPGCRIRTCAISSSLGRDADAQRAGLPARKAHSGHLALPGLRVHCVALADRAKMATSVV